MGLSATIRTVRPAALAERQAGQQHDSEKSGNVMTLEQGSVEAGVKIREPRDAWMWQLVIGVSWLVLAAGNV